MDLKNIKKTKGRFGKRPFAGDFHVFSGKSDRFAFLDAAGGTAAHHGLRRYLFGIAQNLDAVIRRGHVQVAIDFAVRGLLLDGHIAAADQKTLIEVFQRYFRLLARTGNLSINIVLRLVAAVMVLLLELRLIAVIFFVRFVQHALVVFGVLQIAFGQYAVTRALRVARQRQVLFGDLHGVAANAHIGAVAVECLNTRIDAAMAAIVVVMVVLTAAVTVIVVTAAKTSSVLIMSHITHFTLIRRPVFPLLPAQWHAGTPKFDALFCKRDAIYRRRHKFMLLKPESLEKLFFRKMLI